MQQGYSVSDNVRRQFTAKERDSETTLDFFNARYYSSAQGRFTSVDPSMVSIIPSRPQSWNRYSYTYNNPLAYVDSNGKWPTSVHNWIIDTAFRGLTSSQRQIIKEASYRLDTLDGAQTSAKLAYMHGQRAPGQSLKEAAESSYDWISLNQRLARNASDEDEALQYFGNAFHTVSDMTSPAHRGYTVWRGVADYSALASLSPFILGFTVASDLKHVVEESVLHTWQDLGLAVGATLELYRDTFGDEKFNKATGGIMPGSSKDPTFDEINRTYGNEHALADEAAHRYRLGILQGLSFNYRNQGVR